MATTAPNLTPDQILQALQTGQINLQQLMPLLSQQPGYQGPGGDLGAIGTPTRGAGGRGRPNQFEFVDRRNAPLLPGVTPPPPKPPVLPNRPMGGARNPILNVQAGDGGKPSGGGVAENTGNATTDDFGDVVSGITTGPIGALTGVIGNALRGHNPTAQELSLVGLVTSLLGINPTAPATSPDISPEDVENAMNSPAFGGGSVGPSGDTDTPGDVGTEAGVGPGVGSGLGGQHGMGGVAGEAYGGSDTGSDTSADVAGGEGDASLGGDVSGDAGLGGGDAGDAGDGGDAGGDAGSSGGDSGGGGNGDSGSGGGAGAGGDAGGAGGGTGGQATGGEIAGNSPHPMADNVPIQATAGEYMLSNPFLEALAQMLGTTPEGVRDLLDMMQLQATGMEPKNMDGAGPSFMPPQDPSMAPNVPLAPMGGMPPAPMPGAAPAPRGIAAMQAGAPQMPPGLAYGGRVAKPRMGGAYAV